MRGISRFAALAFRKGRVVLSLALMIAFTCSSLGMTAMGNEIASGFKADVPKIDPSAEKPPEVLRPLQAGIRHDAHGQSVGRALRSGASEANRGFTGRARGGARAAESNPLRGNAADPGNGFNIAATSGFGIIGVKFVLALGRPPVINRVFAGTPADKVGLSIQDVIVAVDGVPTSGLTKEEVYDLIIGSPGTPVSLSIMRGADFQVVHCTRMDINDITDPLVRKDYMMSM